MKKLALSALLLTIPAANGAAVAYFTATGKQDLGNPQSFGGENFTGESVAFELRIDFTTAVDAISVPINLWEAGATGSGAAIVLDGDDLHFFAGNSNTHFIGASHGLTAPQNNLQIVGVYVPNAGAAADDLTLYVNGSEIAAGSFVTADIWAGSDSGGLGQVAGGAGARWSGVSDPPFAAASVVDFPANTDISFSVYRLASSGGNADNTLENILIPEPSAFALIGMSGLLMLSRRRKK